ncbi:cytoplasmic protein [Chelativorans sp. AA-79]|uniref:cytoplasmic protein n=1 Tax=Chelativorans sp. AA-79 TaxID=3028735 RepID=UPI0023F68458|nr:cytoplasmic protein [Chelativorans sp. AA-79]WEX11942.1 cytoplasmic protein [Chelativorans sp. AA-79]
MLEQEVHAFRREKAQQVSEARQCAAFFLISGIDLSAALATTGKERTALLARLGRLIERERLKGARRHWSYDLNRHIALKQAYDRLRPAREEERIRPRPMRRRWRARQKESGA